MKLKHLFALIILSCTTLIGWSQDFTRLDWDVLRIDSMLPQYTEVIPLSDDFAAYQYHVSVRYPEYQKLSAQEVSCLKSLAVCLPSEPAVTSNVGVSRKKGYLDVRFTPVVFREGHFFKILSCQINIQRTPKLSVSSLLSVSSRLDGSLRAKEETSPADRYAKSSVLSKGRWVKIRVSDNGVHMLTTSDLQQMGFNDPARVKLYGYGGHLLSEVLPSDSEYDDLVEVPLYKGKNGLLFYARGPVSWDNPKYNYSVGGYVSRHKVNNYSLYGYYFLTEGDNPLTFSDDIYEGTTSVRDTTFMEQVLYERDEFAWYTGGRRLFDSYDYYNGNKQTYKLLTPGALPSGAASLRVVFTAASNSLTTVEPEVNGNPLLSFTISGLVNYLEAVAGERTYYAPYLDESGQTNVTISSTRGHHAHLDFLELNYTRRLEINDASLSFRGTGSKTTEFVLSNPGGRRLSVWRIGDAQHPYAQVSASSTQSVQRIKVKDAQHRFVAVDLDGTFPKPKMVGEVANQDLHSLKSDYDMVIIVPQSGKLIAQAERLAEAHKRLDGLNTLIVRADQIYNEFSSGTPDATAYRRFLKMLYDRAATPEAAPRYLLLFGDAAWDNRMLSGPWKQTKPEDFLLSYQSDDSFSHITSFVMEDYFGLLDDGEGVSLKTEKVDLGIGRFPVSTEQEAKLLVDKTINYMENKEAGAWKNKIVILGDDGDDNLHMKSAEAVAKDIEKAYPEYDLQRIYWDAFPMEVSTTGNSYPEVERRIDQMMEEGALIVNYTGHASAYSMSHEFVLKLEDFRNFSSTKVPLWVTAACDVMPFDTRTDNIGETALLNPSAAAVAFYGTARTVYADDNLYMNRYFSKYVLARDEKGQRYRLGDAIRQSKISLLDPTGNMGIDRTQNKLHYALLGDPALMIGAANYRLVVDSINGKSLSSSDAAWPTLSAGSLVRISGHVERPDGMPMPVFSGSVMTKIYDSEQETTCYNHAGATVPFKFPSRDKVLFSGIDSIQNGHFSVTFPIPLDINYSDKSGRLVLYAISSDKQMEANGYSEQFFVGGTDTQLQTDSVGPQIRVWLNDVENPEGARVNRTPLFRASLKDISGINMTGNGIGHDIELIIDDNPATTYNLNSSFVNEFGDYTSGTVSMLLPQLSAGKHWLKFRAWDTMNNHSEVSCQFEVDPGLRPQVTQLYATQNPARTTTNFVFHYDRPGESCDFTVLVSDFAGRVLWKHTEHNASSGGVYSIPWNLTAGGGARLGTGVYLYQVEVTSSNGVKSKTQANKIVIIGNK